MNQYILAETNFRTLRNQQVDLAVLPWGATEAHNYHLPYATDNMIVEKIAAAAARLAWEKGGRVIVLPCIPYGVNTGQLDTRININLNPSTQMAILNDIADVLDRHGIFKFMILNGHGGNDFKQQIRELGFRFPKMFISVCDWYKAVDQTLFEQGGGHADEMETSMMQFLAPGHVLPLSEAGDGKSKKIQNKSIKWALGMGREEMEPGDSGYWHW